MAPFSENFYQDLLNSLADGVYFTDRDRRIKFWNRAAEEITGFKREEVLGCCCSQNILMHVDSSGRNLCVSGCPLTATMNDGKPRECVVFLHHKDGHRVPVRVQATPVFGDSGEITGAVEIFSSDFRTSQLAQRLEEMEHLALLDPLTGLGNRRYLETQVHARLEELRRNDWPFGVLFIDVDHFKLINDRLGHGMGDKVLKMVGMTLRESSRSFDSIGRWGGEEFLAVIANAEEVRLREIGERFRILVARSETPEMAGCSVTVSIGGAVAQSGDSLESLLYRADEKLYKAKHSGRNMLCV